MPVLHDQTIVRSARADDAEAIVRIYNHYVETSIISFEEEPVTPAEMSRRMDAVRQSALPWLVAEVAGQLIGYAYASRWKTRSAYRFSVEASVYLDTAHTGRGTGSILYHQLFSALRDKPIHAIVAGISLPNEASVALHEKFGFQKVAHFPEVGFKFGKWIDVGYWQRTL